MSTLDLEGFIIGKGSNMTFMLLSLLATWLKVLMY